ncbi:MAG: hypothetical protein NVSMB68_01150 [Thermoanaerobaculia bacterium]
MLERHYDEEALIALLHTGEASAARDPHLAACSTCSDMLASYRVISDVLVEKAVWDLHETSNETAAVRGLQSLRSFAASMESEDEAAVVLIDQLLQSPRQWWVAMVERDERYHTASVLRRLIEVSESKIDTMPPEAVETAAAAIAVGDVLDGADHIQQLQGSAYRQHAFALFYTGDFRRALESIESAQAILDTTAVSDYAIARLNLVRAVVYRALERHEEALVLARSSATVFRSFGDTQRLASAVMTEAYLLMFLHRSHEALSLLQEINQQMSVSIDLDTRARLFNNIAICQKSLGRVGEALQAFQVAAALYDELGINTEGANVRYNIADLLAHEGHRVEGRKRMREVRAEFERLGMIHTSVVAGLDLAELAVVEKNFQEVEDLCRAAIRQFETAGVAHSSEALTALTFLREAAEQRRATQEIIWHVRTYIKRLPDEPALLFAPTPLPPA